jgi:hypothetical protein
MTEFDSDIVFLTGAGASIPVSIPGMAGMVSEFKDNHGRDDQGRKAYDALIDAGVQDDLEEVLQFCNRLIELRDTQITEILRHAVSPRRGTGVSGVWRRLLERIESAELLKDELIRWIGDTCLGFDREKAEEIYGELVPLLAALNVPVFTTNYDGVFDEVARRKRVSVADNFVADKRGRQFWDPTHRAFLRRGLRLVKMHGSIYWHATSDNSVIEKTLQPARRNAEGQLVSQLLIFPTRFKDIYQQNYFPLYSAFTRTLGQARVLILVGHTLRDEYLLAAVRERLKDKSFGLIVVDVERPLALRNLPGRILYLDGSIEMFAPLLYRALSARRDPEKLFAYLDDAQVALKRGRKEKVEVTGVPAWVVPGQVLDNVVLTVETMLGDYTLEAFIQIKGKWEPLMRGNKAKPVRGFGTKSKTLKLRLPRDLERRRSYELSFVLFNEHDKQVARADRKVRVRKG